MSVAIQPAGNYAGLLGASFRHAEIVYAGVGAVRDLPDGSEIFLTEFGVIVRTPDGSPNSFLPYSTIFEIRECAEPDRTAPDDGQQHD